MKHEPALSQSRKTMLKESTYHWHESDILLHCVGRNFHGQLIFFRNVHQKGSIVRSVTATATATTATTSSSRRSGCGGVGMIGLNMKIGRFTGKWVFGSGRVGYQKSKGSILESIRALDLCLS